MNGSPPPRVDERGARQLLLVRAFERDAPTSGESPLWTADDKAWATRLARAACGSDGAPEDFVRLRAHHAAERLRGRDAALGGWLDAHWRLGRWLAAALLVALGAGLAFDRIGPAQHVNLLAPPVWALVLWNLGVLAVVGVQSLRREHPRPRGLRHRLASLWASRPGRTPALLRLAGDWAALSAPVNALRAAALLHAAAAALALGVIAGLYLRGIGLDYRAGWQSTFLEPAGVHLLLSTALLPASALTGIALPDAQAVAALRIGADGVPQAPAAPWLHLYAATLVLFVVAPRLLLAVAALWRLHRRSAAWPVPWHEAYFQGLLRVAAGRPPRIWLLPHAAPPGPGATLALQTLVLAALGSDAQLRLAEPVGHGNEDAVARCTPPPETTLVMVLADLAATPEPDAHGQLLSTLAQSASGSVRVLVIDEAGYARRYAQLPQRLQQRRQAWHELARAHDVPLIGIDLALPSPRPESVAALRLLAGG